MNWQKLKFYALIFGISGVMVGVGMSQRLQNGGSVKLPITLQSTPPKQSQGSNVPEQLSQDFIQISKKVTQSVVSIEVSRKATQTKPEIEDEEDLFNKFFNMPQEDQEDNNSGSGIIIDAEKGYIVTNHHVIENAEEVHVIFNDQQEYKARIIGKDQQSDLAVIQIKSIKGLQAAKLGNSDSIRVGEWVLAIGNPFGLSSSVTAGIVSAIGRADVGIADFEDFIQTDAAINPGNSGGALVNTQGEVIGINTALATRNAGYMGIGFAIPSNMAQKVIQSLIVHGRVSRSQLGIYIRQMEPALAKSLGLKDNNKGIVVTDIIPGSPAALAGLKKYDVVLSLNNTEVNDVNQFRNWVSMIASGTQITLKVLRDKKTLEFKPILKETPTTQTATHPILPSDKFENKLGFKVKSISPETAEKLQIPIHHGVEIASVQEISRAFEEGLVAGDIIVEVNRKEVHSVEEFNRMVAPLKKGDVLLLSVLSEDETRLIAFELEE